MGKRLRAKHRKTARDVARARKEAGGVGRWKHKVATERSTKAKKKKAYRST